MGKWISVKDRMPPKDEIVLVYWPPEKRRNAVTGEIYITGDSIQQNSIIQYNGNSDSLYWRNISSFETHPPTHWMKLPKKPKLE